LFNASYQFTFLSLRPLVFGSTPFKLTEIVLR